MLLRQKSTRGDTIIEVLICIAVAGLVVTGSYALASHSLQEGISATERTQANKLAESQIEALKLREKTSNTAWTAPYPNGFSGIQPTDSFCLDTSAQDESSSNWTPFNLQNSGLPNNLTVGSGAYNNLCTSPQNSSAKYFIDVSANGQTFLVIVRWQAFANGPNNQSQLYYRLP